MRAIRGRFAPTPSGELHLGNAYAAMLAWLQIRKAGGEFIVRIEDIDQPRTKPGMNERILEDLSWLGLNWDEGPDLGGPYRPYLQSKRQHYYDEAIERLHARGLLYPCYCSRAELQSIASAPHGIESEGTVYPGLCRGLTEQQAARRAAKKAPCLRFIMPPLPCCYEDIAAGPQHFAAGAGGDFIVKRADQIISYQLAVVVDDIHMQITDVLRGADLLDSTPRQLQLYEALDAPVPRFAHVPLLHGLDRKRLAKRHGDLSIGALRASGVRPQLLIGKLAALCGLCDRPEAISAKELIDSFALAKLPQQPLVIDPAQFYKLS